MQKHAFGVKLDVIAKLFACICCGFVWIRMGLLFDLCGFVWMCMDVYGIGRICYGFAVDLY